MFKIKRVQKLHNTIYYTILSKVKKFISVSNKVLEIEYHRMDLWYFIFFIFGIIFYFSLEKEPSYRHVFVLFLSSFSLLILKRIGIFGSFIALISIAFISGVFIAKQRQIKIHNKQVLNKRIKSEIEGYVDSIKPLQNGMQITLNNVTAKNLSFKLKKVKLNVKDDFFQPVMIEDKVRVFAALNPVMRSLVPGGYDFGLYSYFSGIVANGYAKEKIEVQQNPENYSINSYIQKFRRAVYNRLIYEMGKTNGNFAAALFLGEGSGIPQDIMQNMRLSGISHILCVSGLHLSLVAMIFFIFFRSLLNCSNFIAYRYNIKNIAAICSLCGSFIYLLFSGAQVAATRAFIMVGAAIFSILINRKSNPLRAMGIAAVIILIFNPEYILHPSFQLSFAAVLSLISGYEFYDKLNNIVKYKAGILFKIKTHILSNMYSSVIASLATTPIVAYHFYISSNYSVLTNLIAVPITSFIVMPIGIFAIALMHLNLGIEYYLLKILSLAITVIIYSAEYVVNLPGSIWYCGYISAFSLFLFMFGFFWFVIWSGYLRHTGFLIMLLSCYVMYKSHKKPVLIYDPNNHVIAYKENDEFIIESEYLNKFLKTFWANWIGVQDLKHKFGKIKIQNKAFQVNNDIKINVNYGFVDCDADIVLNSRSAIICNRSDISLNSKSLKKCGIVAIFCEYKKCFIKCSNNDRFIQ